MHHGCVPIAEVKIKMVQGAGRVKKSEIKKKKIRRMPSATKSPQKGEHGSSVSV